MSVIEVDVVYVARSTGAKRGNRYAIDISQSIEVNISLLCKAFEAPGMAHLYSLLDSNSKVILPNKFKKLKEGSLMTLTIDEKQIKQYPVLVNVISKIEQLTSDDPLAERKAIHELITDLKIHEFANIFSEQNGIQLVMNVAVKSNGNSLAYALAALQSYAQTLGNYSFVSTSLLNKLLQSMFNSNFNVRKHAAMLMAVLTSSTNTSGGIFIRKHRDSLDWSLVLDLLRNTDTYFVGSVIVFINNIISNQLDAEKQTGHFVRKLQKLGILPLMNAITRSEDIEVRQGLHTFQKHYLKWLVRYKNVTFDPENPSHVWLLRRLWSVAFADLEFGGVEHELYKQMGFQAKNPGSDLRAMGVLGLIHLVYYAETYISSFLEKISDLEYAQAHLEPEYQLPICAVGINISRLVMNVFSIEKDQPDSADVFPMVIYPNGLLNIYCCILNYTYYQWKQKNYTYLQFGLLLQEIQNKVSNILTQNGDKSLTAEQFMNFLTDDAPQARLVLQQPGLDDHQVASDGEQFMDPRELNIIPHKPTSNVSTETKEKQGSINLVTIQNLSLAPPIEDTTENKDTQNIIQHS